MVMVYPDSTFIPEGPDSDLEEPSGDWRDIAAEQMDEQPLVQGGEAPAAKTIPQTGAPLKQVPVPYWMMESMREVHHAVVNIRESDHQMSGLQGYVSGRKGLSKPHLEAMKGEADKLMLILVPAESEKEALAKASLILEVPEGSIDLNFMTDSRAAAHPVPEALAGPMPIRYMPEKFEDDERTRIGLSFHRAARGHLPDHIKLVAGGGFGEEFRLAKELAHNNLLLPDDLRRSLDAEIDLIKLWREAAADESCNYNPFAHHVLINGTSPDMPDIKPAPPTPGPPTPGPPEPPAGAPDSDSDESTTAPKPNLANWLSKLPDMADFADPQSEEGKMGHKDAVAYWEFDTETNPKRKLVLEEVEKFKPLMPDYLDGHIGLPLSFRKALLEESEALDLSHLQNVAECHKRSQVYTFKDGQVLDFRDVDDGSRENAKPPPVEKLTHKVNADELYAIATDLDNYEVHDSMERYKSTIQATRDVGRGKMKARHSLLNTMMDPGCVLPAKDYIFKNLMRTLEKIMAASEGVGGGIRRDLTAVTPLIRCMREGTAYGLYNPYADEIMRKAVKSAATEASPTGEVSEESEASKRRKAAQKTQNPKLSKEILHLAAVVSWNKKEKETMRKAGEVYSYYWVNDYASDHRNLVDTAKKLGLDLKALSELISECYRPEYDKEWASLSRHRETYIAKYWTAKGHQNRDERKKAMRKLASSARGRSRTSKASQAQSEVSVGGTRRSARISQRAASDAGSATKLAGSTKKPPPATPTKTKSAEDWAIKPTKPASATKKATPAKKQATKRAGKSSSKTSAKSDTSLPSASEAGEETEDDSQAPSNSAAHDPAGTSAGPVPAPATATAAGTGAYVKSQYGPHEYPPVNYPDVLDEPWIRGQGLRGYHPPDNKAGYQKLHEGNWDRNKNGFYRPGGNPEGVAGDPDHANAIIPRKFSKDLKWLADLIPMILKINKVPKFDIEAKDKKSNNKGKIVPGEPGRKGHISKSALQKFGTDSNGFCHFTPKGHIAKDSWLMRVDPRLLGIPNAIWDRFHEGREWDEKHWAKPRLFDIKGMPLAEEPQMRTRGGQFGRSVSVSSMGSGSRDRSTVRSRSASVASGRQGSIVESVDGTMYRRLSDIFVDDLHTETKFRMLFEAQRHIFPKEYNKKWDDLVKQPAKDAYGVVERLSKRTIQEMKTFKDEFGGVKEALEQRDKNAEWYKEQNAKLQMREEDARIRDINLIARERELQRQTDKQTEAVRQLREELDKIAEDHSKLQTAAEADPALKSALSKAGIPTDMPDGLSEALKNAWEGGSAEDELPDAPPADQPSDEPETMDVQLLKRRRELPTAELTDQDIADIRQVAGGLAQSIQAQLVARADEDAGVTASDHVTTYLEFIKQTLLELTADMRLPTPPVPPKKRKPSKPKPKAGATTTTRGRQGKRQAKGDSTDDDAPGTDDDEVSAAQLPF